MFSFSLKTLLILFALVALVLSCHPGQGRARGRCKYYVDGTSDTDKSGSGSGGGSGSGSGGSKENGQQKFRRTKKKKNVPCYHYEDGSRDPGAKLRPGVAEYQVTVTKTRG